MSITSQLFKLARMSADARAISRSVETGDPTPIIRRIFNKAVGRTLFSKLTWRK